MNATSITSIGYRKNSQKRLDASGFLKKIPRIHEAVCSFRQILMKSNGKSHRKLGQIGRFRCFVLKN